MEKEKLTDDNWYCVECNKKKEEYEALYCDECYIVFCIPNPLDIPF